MEGGIAEMMMKKRREEEGTSSGGHRSSSLRVGTRIPHLKAKQKQHSINTSIDEQTSTAEATVALENSNEQLLSFEQEQSKASVAATATATALLKNLEEMKKMGNLDDKQQALLEQIVSDANALAKNYYK